MNIRIRAISTDLPGKCISSAELARHAGIPEGRIEKNAGVFHRYHAHESDTLSDMGARALLRALSEADLPARELDLLLFTGASFDYPIPHNAALVKSKVTGDEADFPCFDIDATCLSFLNGLEIAHLYLETGRCRRIAIVCAEMASRALDPRDEKTFGLFGDAAVAMILERSDEGGYRPGYGRFVNYPSGALLAHLKVGGAVNRGRHEPADSAGYFFAMDGKKLIRLTTQYLEVFMQNLEEQSGIRLSEFDHFVTHQTSRYGNEYFIRNFGIPPHKVVNTLTGFGNCISASIPLGLEQLVKQEGGNLRGKKVLLLGSAAGLSLGCQVLEFM